MPTAPARLSYLALALRYFEANATLLGEVLGLPRLDSDPGPVARGSASLHPALIGGRLLDVVEQDEI